MKTNTLDKLKLDYSEPAEAPQELYGSGLDKQAKLYLWIKKGYNYKTEIIIEELKGLIDNGLARIGLPPIEIVCFARDRKALIIDLRLPLPYLQPSINVSKSIAVLVCDRDNLHYKVLMQAAKIAKAKLVLAEEKKAEKYVDLELEFLDLTPAE